MKWRLKKKTDTKNPPNKKKQIIRDQITTNILKRTKLIISNNDFINTLQMVT